MITYSLIHYSLELQGTSIYCMVVRLVTGAFTNYVDKILPMIDIPAFDICDGIPLLL